MSHIEYVSNILKSKNFEYRENEFGMENDHFLALSGQVEFNKPVIYDNNTKASQYHYLAISGNYDALMEAISRKIINPFTYVNLNGSTVFHWLAACNNYETIKKAIKDNPLIVYIQTNYGNNMFYNAALYGHIEIVINAINDGYCDIKNDHIIDGFSYNFPEKIIELYNIHKFDVSLIPEKFRHMINDSQRYTKIKSIKERYEKTGDKQIDIPDRLKCGISHELMFDPVLTEYGQIYDRESITEWLKDRDTCPLTNKTLETKKLYPCVFLDNEIEDFLKKHGV